MKKSILHLSHTNVSTDNRILKELKAIEGLDGYDITAVGINAYEGLASPLFVPKAKIINLNLVSKKIPWAIPRPLRLTLTLVELTLRVTILALRLKPSLVHCHDTLVLPVGYLIQRLTGCKLIYDAHELESNKNGQTALLSKGTLWIERFCWKRIDLLISVSDSIIEWYNSTIGPIPSILVLNSPEVPIPVHSIPAFPRGDRYFHKLYKLAEDSIIFVYLGYLGPGRGIETCLEAFSEADPRAHLVFVGYGDFGARIVSYCQKFPNIHFHKPVPHEQVVQIVKDADFGLCFIENVSLSDYYCLPNKLFEYCFAGLPVLACDFPDISRVVKRHSLGICCPPEPLSIRDAIRRVIDNPPQPISSDLSELSWPTQAARVRDAYARLLKIN